MSGLRCLIRSPFFIRYLIVFGVLSILQRILVQDDKSVQTTASLNRVAVMSDLRLLDTDDHGIRSRQVLHSC